jgi:hypothetical protein
MRDMLTSAARMGIPVRVPTAVLAEACRGICLVLTPRSGPAPRGAGPEMVQRCVVLVWLMWRGHAAVIASWVITSRAVCGRRAVARPNTEAISASPPSPKATREAM